MEEKGINLFVIGNGFDLAHGFHTRYSDFKKFLREKGNVNDKLILNDHPRLPLPQIHCTDKEGNGAVLAEYEKEAALLYWLIEKAAKNTKCGIKDWSDFEDAIMRMDFSALDIKEDWDLMAIRQTVEDLPGMFFEWASKITIDRTAPRLASICEFAEPDEDIVLCFNYTETLEKLYGFKKENICYIHGKRMQEVPDEYEQQYYWSYGEEKARMVVGGNEPKNPRSDPYIIIRGSLIKDTDMAISENKTFFERIQKSNIRNIFSYGFSFSLVDQPYIEKICSEIDNTRKIAWTVFIYDKADKRKLCQRLRKAGFKGKVRFISCKKDVDITLLPLKRLNKILLNRISLSQSFETNYKQTKIVYSFLSVVLQEYVYQYLINNRKKKQSFPDISKMFVLSMPVMTIAVSLLSNVQGLIRSQTRDYSSQAIDSYYKVCVLLLCMALLSYFMDYLLVVMNNRALDKRIVLTEIVSMLHDSSAQVERESN